MIAVILAGGFGFRFNETTEKLPKLLVTVASIPLILYVICIYSSIIVKLKNVLTFKEVLKLTFS